MNGILVQPTINIFLHEFREREAKHSIVVNIRMHCGKYEDFDFSLLAQYTNLNFFLAQSLQALAVATIDL